MVGRWGRGLLVEGSAFQGLRAGEEFALGEKAVGTTQVVKR